MCIALLGAALGVMNTWNAMNQQRIRVRVTPNFVTSMDGRPLGISIEAINLSAFALTIKEIGFTSDRGRLPLLAAQFPDGASLPWRLAPREAASAMITPSDFGIPPVRLGDAYVRTACGRTILGNSPAGRQFSEMIAELTKENGVS
jgi:hypothetical protein